MGAILLYIAPCTSFICYMLAGMVEKALRTEWDYSIIVYSAGNELPDIINHHMVKLEVGYEVLGRLGG